MATTKPDLKEVWANTPAPEDIEKPLTAKIASGWIFGEKPPNSWMNWLQNTFSKAFANLNERGVLSWDIDTTYLAGAFVSDNGKVYKARVQNTGQNIALTTQWQEQSLPDMPTSGNGYILYYSGSKLFWKDQGDINYGGYEGRDASTAKSLILLNDNTLGNVPLPTELNVGELSVNYADRTMFTKRPDGTIVPLSGQASIVDFEYTVTAETQATFSPAGGYTVNQLEVFVNGRKIGKEEFTANNGIDVIFTGFIPVTFDLVVISVWASFGITDAYTQNQVDALLAEAERPAKGGGLDEVFYENDMVITQDYALRVGKNAMTAGAVSINNGVTVTVPDGANWSIV